jgi:hypothetical protein
MMLSTELLPLADIVCMVSKDGGMWCVPPFQRLVSYLKKSMVCGLVCLEVIPRYVRSCEDH